jgi:hypothetical protein
MMTKRTLGMIGSMTVAAAGLPAQIGGGIVGYGVGRTAGTAPAEYQVFQFQQVQTIGAPAGGRGVLMPVTVKGLAPLVGRPVSATEERKSVQTLGDGTEISTSETSLYFRDSQGRERTETTQQGRTAITITDRVGGFTVVLIPETKTARKSVLPGGPYPNMTATELVTGKVSTANGGNAVLWTTATTAPPAKAAAPVGAGRGGRGGRGNSENVVNEQLGLQSLNGVLATGTRSTLTIPLGQIGNNRDIHVVNEQWFSEDLQMLVKTLNSDPRFGENTYELTYISRIEPDPALFQIPPDYRVIEPGAGRGGRGQATGPAQPASPAPQINK